MELYVTMEETGRIVKR